MATEVVEAAPVFAALGDATRLGIVTRLAAGEPLSIARLTEGTEVTRQAVTKHLRVLADAGLVRDLRRGRERVWELEGARLDEARAFLDAVSDRWGRAIERLRSAVEADEP